MSFKIFRFGHYQWWVGMGAPAHNGPHEVDSSTSGVDVAQRSGHAEKTQKREIYRLVRVQGLEAAMGPVAFGLGSQLEGTGEAAG